MVGKRAPKIPHNRVKQIIEECPDKRTQALIAFQYAMGNRAGELAREYMHKVSKLKPFMEDRFDDDTGKIVRVRTKRLELVDEFRSEGARVDQFYLTPDGLEWESPNFKSKKQKTKNAWVLKELEPWLYTVLLSWLNFRKGKKFLFGIRHSRIKGLVDKELKKYNKEYSSHSLRRSRATHLASITRGNPFVVKEVLGHARIETSAKYISFSKEDLKRIIKQEE